MSRLFEEIMVQAYLLYFKWVYWRAGVRSEARRRKVRNDVR